MLIIGGDLHKDTHTCAAVIDGTGEFQGHFSFAAVGEGFVEVLDWAKELGDDRVWAVEDCRGVSKNFEDFLISSGERVVRVAPHLTVKSRNRSRDRGKTDEIDALAVARVALREGVDTLPEAIIDQRAMEIKLLLDHHDILVKSRTQNQNRLRDVLHQLWPEFKLLKACLNRKKWVTQITRMLSKAPQEVRVGIARQLLERVKQENQSIADLKTQLQTLVADYAPQLLEENGCGVLSAARVIAEIGGIERFRSDARLARMAGTAPIPVSSGKTTRYRLDRGGNRKLNAAIYRIALTKMRVCEETKAYIARKRAQGKTTKEALRSLKRHLVRRIFNLLTKKGNPQLATIG
jgi:transposase